MNPRSPASGNAQNGREGAGVGQVSAAAVRAALQQALTQDEACVLCLGDGPFTRRNMEAFLAHGGIAPLDTRSEVRPLLLVCGRDNLNTDRVRRLVRAPHRALHRAPVLCAQEHALGGLFSLWEERSGTGLVTLQKHPIQRWLAPLGALPEDAASAERSPAPSADIFCHGDLLQGLPYIECAIHGTQARRRKVLRQAYVMDPWALEQIAAAADARWAEVARSPSQSHRSWGERRSATRLQHLARSLSRAQQQVGPLNTPLRSICSRDLSWLRTNMYDAGGFDFPWPAA